MCLTPIYIDNPHYNYPFLKNNPDYAKLHDTVSAKLAVPCGHCPVCLHLKQIYITQRVQMESLSHDLYFLTLTYNDEMIPRAHFGEFHFSYVNLSDWQSMLKMIRKYEDLPDFKYFLVTEYGGRRHRPHLHAILSFPKDDRSTLADRISFEIKLQTIFLKYWRRNINFIDAFTKTGKQKVNTRFPIWKPLCTYVRKLNRTNFELHYLNPWSSTNGLDDIAFYVSKYCLKFDSWLEKFRSKLFFNLSESDFSDAWDLLRPRRLMSKGFGSPTDDKVVYHINKGINLALKCPDALFPYFINPVQGNTFPLSPYYVKKYLRTDDKLVFRSRMPQTDDGAIISDPRYTPSEIDKKYNDFIKVKDVLNSYHSLFDDDANSFNDFLIDTSNEEIPILGRCGFGMSDFKSSATEFTSGFTDA